jgi:hypothetical protein
MVHSSLKVELHHGVARSRGGSDEDWNLHPLTEYSHAETHAIDFVLFEIAPDFDFRMEGWPLLPLDLRKAVRKEKSRRMRKNNPSRRPEVKQRKKETFAKNGTHNFQTPEGRERNRQRAVKRNKEGNILHNSSPLMIAVTLANNAVRCCCLTCKKECSRPGMGRHLKTHK